MHVRFPVWYGFLSICDVSRFIETDIGFSGPAMNTGVVSWARSLGRRLPHVNSLHRILQAVDYCYNGRVIVTMTGYPLQSMPSVDVHSHRCILGKEIEC